MVSTVGLNVGTGAVQGAMAGAAIGAEMGAYGGPIGMAVGAIAGTAYGLATSKKAKKAKKALAAASAIQTQREQNAVNAQYVQLIRQARVARAGSLAAGIATGLSTSSLQTSALSSIGSQAQYNVQSLAEDRRLYSLYKQYMERAGAMAQGYQNNLAMGDLVMRAGVNFAEPIAKTGEMLYTGAKTAGAYTSKFFGDMYDGVSSYITNLKANSTDVGPFPIDMYGGVEIKDA